MPRPRPPVPGSTLRRRSTSRRRIPTPPPTCRSRPMPRPKPVRRAATRSRKTDEACDDGNTKPGDGCSGICAVEPDYTCPAVGQPCVSQVVCGDGKITGNEACDDGNAAGGDGCSAACQVEGGLRLQHAGQPCTRWSPPAAATASSTAARAATTATSPAATAARRPARSKAATSVPRPGKPCVRDAFCGDGRLDPNEQCDDNNPTPGDGCTGGCMRRAVLRLPDPGAGLRQHHRLRRRQGHRATRPATTATTSPATAAPPTASRSSRATPARARCGVGGPVHRGDPGHAAATAAQLRQRRVLRRRQRHRRRRLQRHLPRSKPGYSCPRGGHGLRRGRTLRRRQAVAWPTAKPATTATPPPATAAAAQCARRGQLRLPDARAALRVHRRLRRRQRRRAGETCDDGNTTAGDGCSATCALEDGWTCPSGGVCRAARCGDGIRRGAEQCDDGNAASGDGCSAACVVESRRARPSDDGWSACTAGRGRARAPTCGNGTLEGTEQCDDGEQRPGRRLHAVLSQGADCPAGGGACTTGCGDGLMLPVDIAQGQECDDGNTVSGDGCSADCKTGTGLRLPGDRVHPGPAGLAGHPARLQGVHRRTNRPGTPISSSTTASEAGIVQADAGRDGKPVHVTANQASTATTSDQRSAGTDCFRHVVRGHRRHTTGPCATC